MSATAYVRVTCVDRFTQTSDIRPALRGRKEESCTATKNGHRQRECQTFKFSEKSKMFVDTLENMKAYICIYIMYIYYF